MSRKGEIGITTIIVLSLALIALLIGSYFGIRTFKEGSHLNTCSAMNGIYVPKEYCNSDDDLTQLENDKGYICCPKDAVDETYKEKLNKVLNTKIYLNGNNEEYNLLRAEKLSITPGTYKLNISGEIENCKWELRSSNNVLMKNDCEKPIYINPENKDLVLIITGKQLDEDVKIKIPITLERKKAKIIEFTQEIKLTRNGMYYNFNYTSLKNDINIYVYNSKCSEELLDNKNKVVMSGKGDHGNIKLNINKVEDIRNLCIIAEKNYEYELISPASQRISYILEKPDIIITPAVVDEKQLRKVVIDYSALVNKYKNKIILDTCDTTTGKWDCGGLIPDSNEQRTELTIDNPSYFEYLTESFKLSYIAETNIDGYTFKYAGLIE